MTPAQLLVLINNILSAAGGIVSNIAQNSNYWELLDRYRTLVNAPTPLTPPIAPVAGPNPKRNELDVVLYQVNLILAANGGLESNIPVGVIDAYWRLVNRYRAILNAPPLPGSVNG